MLDSKGPLLPQIWAANKSWDEYQAAIKPRKGAAQILPGQLDAFVRTSFPLHCYTLFLVTSFLLSCTLVPVTDLIFGAMACPAAEYTLHRFALHELPDRIKPGRLGQCLHFVVHGYHHMFPRDAGLLMWPYPVSLGVMAASAALLACTGVALGTAVGVCGGFWIGQAVYDVMHFFIHCQPMQADFPALKRWLDPQIRHHTNHHHASGPASQRYGVSTTFVDDMLSKNE